jgi:hypothetical protein
MILQAFIHSLNEKAKPAPNWSETSGIYANYSEYPDIKFYVKCPKCGEVHGTYKDMRDAHSKRLCSHCDVEAINKAKKMIHDVDSPKSKGKPAKSFALSRVFNERLPARANKAVGTLLEDDPDFDADEYMSSKSEPAGSDWINVALANLADETYHQFQIDDPRNPFDLDDPAEVAVTPKVQVVSDEGEEYTLYRTEEHAEREAIAQNVEDITGNDCQFSPDFLVNYVNMDRLKRDLSDSARDVEWLDRDPKRRIDYLIKEGLLEEDDFYTPTGRFRKVTPRTDRLVDNAVEALADKREAEFDPMEFLREIYGEDYMKEAIRIGGINAQEAAEAAVRADGWAHFLSHYDGSYLDLRGGAVAVRTS